MGRVNEGISNRETSELDRHLHEDLVGRVSRIVLEFGIRFDYERGQYRGEQTGLYVLPNQTLLGTVLSSGDTHIYEQSINLLIPHLYFGKSLNPLKTSNLEVLEVLDRFRGIRTLEGLEVWRDIRQVSSTCAQLKQYNTSIVISQQRVKSELRVPWPVEEQNATKQN